MFAVTFLLPALAPVSSLTADVKAQSSTHFHWHYDLFRDKPQGDFLQYSFASSDPGACVHNGWYAAQLLYESPDESATEF